MNNRSEQKQSILIRSILTIGIIFVLSLWEKVNFDNICQIIAVVILLIFFFAIDGYTDKMIHKFGEQTYTPFTLIYSNVFIIVSIIGAWFMLINQQNDYQAIAIVFLLNIANDGVVFFDLAINDSNKMLTPFRHGWLIVGLIYALLKLRYGSPAECYIVIFLISIGISTFIKAAAYVTLFKVEYLEKEEQRIQSLFRGEEK